MFREKFPNATEFDINLRTIGYKNRETKDDEIKLTAMFLNSLAKAGAKKIRLSMYSSYANTGYINKFVAAPLALGNLDTLILQKDPGVVGELELPLLLAATANVRKLSITGIRNFTGTQGEMDKVRSNLSEISITNCSERYSVQPIKLTLDERNFPKLKKVTLGAECAQTINLTSFLSMQALISSLFPHELIQVAEESISSTK
jgi:hypothetical protein